MKISLRSIGKLASGLAQKIVSDTVVQTARDIIQTAEDSGLTGEEKRKAVLDKLRNTPGTVSKQFGSLPTYLQNLFLESVLADVLGKLKVN